MIFCCGSCRRRIDMAIDNILGEKALQGISAPLGGRFGRIGSRLLQPTGRFWRRSLDIER
jgi:hypothetical protein